LRPSAKVPVGEPAIRAMSGRPCWPVVASSMAWNRRLRRTPGMAAFFGGLITKSTNFGPSPNCD
jgi:hypothetical protein